MVTPTRVVARRSTLMYQLEGEADFVLLDLESGAEEPLLGAEPGGHDALFARFSPDSEHVVLMVDSAGSPGGLSIVDLRDRSVRRLLDSAALYPVPLRWSTPDSIHVALDGELVLVSASTGAQRPVASLPEWCYDVDLLPGRNTAFCSRGDAFIDIWLGRAPGEGDGPAGP